MKNKQTYTTQEERENCIVIVVCSKKSDDKQRKLDEIVRLAESTELNVLASFSQNIKDFNKSTVIGSGKLDEIKGFIDSSEQQIDVAIVDYALTGSQMKNISNALGVRVVDRVGLIIDIFALGAKSSEAKLQVKLAQDRYLLPRLSEIQGSSGRFGGAGVGMRGPGETKLELNRRVLENEMTALKKQISKIKEQRQVTRRSRQNTKKVAIVGYTNAGKSSLINVLTKEQVYSDDKLFATLDTTSRKLYLGIGQVAVITDTVGFISDLPHELVDAFSATLEEARDADLILHVVDVSQSKLIQGVEEFKLNMKVTNEVLDSLHATGERVIVYNKADKLKVPLLLKENEVLISAKTGKGINDLVDLIRNKLYYGIEEL